MKKTIIYTITFCLVIFLFSCGGGTDTTQKNADSVKNTVKVETELPVVKHTLKSAIISYDAEIMGMKKKQKTYFDDFGEKQCVELVGEFQGQKVNQRTLTLGNDVYILDMLKKTGTKAKRMSPLESGDYDYVPTSESIMKQLNIKKEGSEEIFKKNCEKYSINNEMITGYFWVWDNIPLKIQVKNMKIRNKFEVTKLEENVSIPAEIFQVPADFKIE